MTKTHITRMSAIAFLCVWVGVSLLALVMMYKLWWSRERVDYGGKERLEQVSAVCKNAGIRYDNLGAFLEETRGWGSREVYHARGDHTKLSYVSYLLAPHIPDDAEMAVVLKDRQLSIEGGPGGSNSAAAHFYESTRSAWALLGALLVIAGIGLGLRESVRKVGLSTPESLGLGVGLVSTLVLLSKAFTGTVDMGCWAALVTGVLGWNVYTQSMIRKEIGFRDLFRRPGVTAVLAGGFSVLVVLWAVLMAVIVVPDDWDAWAIWGPKARVLLGVGPLADVQHFGHADYPLLWPSIWAFTGWFNQGWEEYFVRGWGAIFLGLTSWQCGMIIHRVSKSGMMAWGAALGILSVPFFPLIASWGYAEAPLWLMLTCAFGRLVAWEDGNASRDAICLAILAAAAAMCKNEGLMFGVLMLGLMAVGGGVSHIKRSGVAIGLFLVLVLPWTIWVRSEIGMETHALLGFGGDGRLAYALGRVPEACRKIVEMWIDVRRWNVVLAAGLLLSVVGLIRGSWSLRRLISVPLAGLCVMFVIIVFHKDPVGWQVGTAWDRFTLQVLPMLVVVALMTLVSMRSGASVDTRPVD